MASKRKKSGDKAEGEGGRTLTPMMRQYHEIKGRYPDAVLLFRMGDFYEIFFDDALTVGPLLELALTSRDKDSPEPIPFCGFPHHALDGYIARLISAGHRVAVCDQLEDPAEAKGIVRRDVVRIVTPGMVVGGELLEEGRNNFLAALGVVDGSTGLAVVDVSTGELRVTQLLSERGLADEVDRFDPREILVPEGYAAPGRLAGDERLFEQPLDRFDPERGRQRVLGIFGEGANGVAAGTPGAMDAALGAVLSYLEWTQRGIPGHLAAPQVYQAGEHLVLDGNAARNLELVQSLADGGRAGTLLSVLDRTRTPMGSRLLRRWLLEPLVDPGRIAARHAAVAELLEAMGVRADLRDALGDIGDIERLNAKVSTGRAHARDLVRLTASLRALPALRAALGALGEPRATALVDRIDPLDDVADDIGATLVDDPPLNAADGGLVRDGVDAELDEARALMSDGRSWVARLEAEERERTGISKIKVGYNRVFGYYLEVAKSMSDRVPEEWIRKQTLVNAERYVTPDLKEMEAKILGAEERARKLEQRLFQELRERVAARAAAIAETAAAVAEADALTSFAEAAEANRYVRPTVDDGLVLELEESRHPVVERVLKRDAFVPNEVRLDAERSQLLLITGPNMAGKSTYMRQVALAVVMAQAGSFVPASSARIGVVDRIFTRVGASDRLSEGQSTFMVEMVETAEIVRECTDRSLVILDEIGRGTSTYDGVSIAWAVAERLHEGPARPRTLFATHYHELTELAARLERVENRNVAVREWGEEILFLHRILEGAASRSYGIQVARLAGLPREVIQRAREILASLEDEHARQSTIPETAGGRREPDAQLDLFRPRGDEVTDELARIRVEELTPLEALNLLDRLVRRVREA